MDNDTQKLVLKSLIAMMSPEEQERIEVIAETLRYILASGVCAKAAFALVTIESTKDL